MTNAPAFQHVRSEGYVHVYRNGGVTAFYNALNLELAYVGGTVSDAKSPLAEQVAAADLHALQQAGLDPELGWSRSSEALCDLQERASDEGIRTAYFMPAMACNYRCGYCQFIQVYDQITGYERMTVETAHRLVHEFYAMSAKAPAKGRDIVFFGGEPFMAADIVIETMRYVREDLGDKELNFIAFTNGSLITDEIAEACAKYNLYAIVSIDGPAEMHDRARVDLVGGGTFDKTVRGFRRFKQAGCRTGISLMAGRHNVAELRRSVEWLIDNLQPDEMGIAGVFHPLGNTPNPYQAEAGAVVDSLVETYVTCRERGVYVDQVARRLRPFVAQRAKLKDCMACGGKIIATPQGMRGHCEYLAFLETSPKQAHRQELVQLRGNRDEDWNRRSPVRNNDCQNCPALGVCGGGCPYNAYKLSGSLDSLDLENCDQTRGLLAWMLGDLYRVVCEQGPLRPGEVRFPSPRERQALFGSVDADDDNLPMRTVSTHGEAARSSQT